jgi:hypothetical protein
MFIAPNQDAGAAEASALRDGRLAWCRYLDAIYVRVKGGASWPGLARCAATPTTASAAMLEDAAQCSRRVLDGFEGSPLTPEYAARASACGAQAFDRRDADAAEVTKLSSAICAHASTCGAMARAECLPKVEASLGPHLARVVGALHAGARTELASCIEHARCGDVADDVTRCLDPMMDRLFYDGNDGA